MSLAFEKLIEEISESNSYTIVEKCQAIVRKLKRAGKLDEAMIYLMKVAHRLADFGEWHPAAVTAKRAIELFPTNATTIKTVLKRLFISFAERATPEAACTDLFTYYRNLMIIIGDENDKFLRKQAEIADLSNHYLHAQSFYLEIIKKNNESPRSYSSEYITEAIQGLAQLTLRWITNIEDKEQQRFTAPFVVARCVLMLLCIKDQGINHGEKLFSIIMQLNPFTEDKLFESPLINFLGLYIKAAKEKSQPTSEFLINAYKPILDLDPDLIRWANKTQSSLYPQTNQIPNYGAMIQNMLGSLLGSANPAP